MQPKLLLPVFLLFTLSPALLAANGDSVEESFIPRYAVAGSYFDWSGDADFDGGEGSMGKYGAGIEANVPVFVRDGFRITAGAKYRYDRLEFSGAPMPLGTGDYDLHRVDVPFNVWGDLSDRWKLWVRLSPGCYTDFDNVGSDDFILTTLGLLSYRWTDSIKVAFGAYYSRDLGEKRFLPAAGLIWEPDPQWYFALTFPRAELAYAPTRDWVFTARALLNGAGWNITDPAGGDRDVDLNYQAIRVGLGIDRRISGPWWAYLDAGAQFGQEIEIDGGLEPFSSDLDTSAYVVGGVKLRF